MNVFTKLGEFLGNRYSQKDTEAKVNHTLIITAIENARVAVTGVLDVIERKENQAFLGKVTQAIKNREYTSPLDKELLTIYTRFTKELNQRQKNRETSSFMGSVVDVLKANLADIELIDSNFKKLFSDFTTVNDIKISHSYVLGYLNLVETTADLFNDMIILLGYGQGNGTMRAPAYLKERLNKKSAIVAMFVNNISERSHGQTVLKEVERIRKDGVDVFMMIDGKPLSEYARERDYQKNVQETVTQGLSLMPTVWIGDSIVAVQRWNYDRRKQMREWLSTKVALMTMDLEGVDPNSKEYMAKKKVLDNYTKTIAELDYKISQYEDV